MKQLFSQYAGLKREIYILFIGKLVTAMGSFVWPMLTFFLTTKLGLSKMESSQITYVNMHEQDRSQITAKGQEKTGAEMISGTAGEIMEYLKLK